MFCELVIEKIFIESFENIANSGIVATYPLRSYLLSPLIPILYRETNRNKIVLISIKIPNIYLHPICINNAFYNISFFQIFSMRYPKRCL